VVIISGGWYVNRWGKTELIRPWDCLTFCKLFPRCAFSGSTRLKISPLKASAGQVYMKTLAFRVLLPENHLFLCAVSIISEIYVVL
jgi:hypothetical protein